MIQLRMPFVAALILFLSLSVRAQNIPGEMSNPILTAVPSLTITPDARGGSMGDLGAATTADANSQFWNASKYAFAESAAGVAFNYTPWLRKLVNDIDLATLTGYFKFGADQNQAVGASLRYFSLGRIDVYQDPDDPGYSINPNEFSFDVSYSRQLSRKFSMGVAARYIYSGIHVDDRTEPGHAFAADISGYYRTTFENFTNPQHLSLGFNISNIGTKISYDGGSNSTFLPTNLKIGAGYQFDIDNYNTISINADLNKLLVPTPPIKLEGEAQEDFDLRKEKYNTMSPVAGIFSAFYEAPGGFKEKLQEIYWSVGLEYVYNKQFAVRLGYFDEHQYKGNRKFFSVGAGFKLNIFSLDAAYLISTAQASPLDQTLRFTLAFDLNGINNLLK